MIREHQPCETAGKEAAARGNPVTASECPRNLVSAMPDQNPIVEIGPDGEVRYMNSAASRLFPDLRQQGLSHPWLAPCAVMARESPAGECRMAIVEVEFAGRAYQLAVCCGAKERSLRVYGIDVTQHKRAEEALRQAHDELQAIYNAMVDGLLIADAETKHFVRANPGICAMLGYSEERLLSMSVMDIHPPDKLPRALAAFEDLVRGHARIAEALPILRGDGTIFHADISTSLLTYRGRLAVLGIFRDITERARAEAALRASEERYRAVVEDQTEVICRFTADGTLTFVNDVFCRFFGKACNELIGRKWQALAMPDELPMVERQLLAMSPANPIAVIENRIRSDRGEIRWMQFVYRGFFDPSGRLVEVQAVGRDVTDLKKAQEALAREHRALKRLLQSSDHERRLIAYEIHDGLAQQLAGALMQFETYAYQKDKLPEFADRAFEAGMAMLRQAHFETRRLISGVRPPILDEAGIMAAISHLVNEEQRKGGPRIELHGRIEHERLSPILENAIYRIVQEALANACQHSQSELVVVSLTQECCKIRIEVRDQGIGFDPEAIAENQFGVAGIRERARLLGGIATIESSPGQGTRIAVELPLIFPNEANAGTPGRDTISKREKSP